MCLVDEIGVEDDGSVGSVGDDHRTELESVPLLLSGGRDRAGRVARLRGASRVLPSFAVLIRATAVDPLACRSVPWYQGILGWPREIVLSETGIMVERVQTGVRLEKRILKVLKALAELHDMTLGDLIEGIVLHAFEGKGAFQP